MNTLLVENFELKIKHKINLKIISIKIKKNDQKS